MQAIVRLYSIFPNEIYKFLSSFFGNTNLDMNNNLTEWQQNYPNPIEIVDIIGSYIENIDDYKLSMWISLDKDVFIKVTTDNADELIRYLYERYPY